MRKSLRRPPALPRVNALGHRTLPGLVLRIPVQEGDHVEDGQEIIVLEGMKMENPIYAPKTGTVAAILVKQGDHVKAGDVLVEIE